VISKRGIGGDYRGVVALRGEFGERLGPSIRRVRGADIIAVDLPIRLPILP